MIYIKLVSVMVIWGATFSSGRILARSLPPLDITFLRFFIASVFFFFLFHSDILQTIKKIDKRSLVIIIAQALTGVVFYNLLFFSGLKTISASEASIIIALNPIITNLLSITLKLESFHIKTLLGSIVSFLGVLIIISKLKPLNATFMQGHLQLLGAACCWSLYTIFGKLTLGKLSSKSSTGISTIIGTIILFLFIKDTSYSNLTLNQTSHLIFLGLVATTLGFKWYYDGIKVLGPSKSSSFINLVPIFGTLFGFILLSEIPHYTFYIGAVTTLSGIKLVSFSKNLSKLNK